MRHMEPIRTVTPRVSAPVISAAVTLVAFGVMGNLASAGPVETTLQPRMGDPVPGMTTLQMELFLAGKERYEHVFQPLEGLGPIFNKESCANCHANPVGGAGSQTVTRFGSLGKFGFDPLVGLGGPLLQASSISVECAEVMPPEANVETKRRTSGGAMGYGLIEAIADDDILAVRDAQPKEVQGVANMVIALESPTVERVGRFGWKAQLPTVLSFSADASLMEIGLTNILLNTENAPNGDLDLLAECDMVPVEPGRVGRSARQRGLLLHQPGDSLPALPRAGSADPQVGHDRRGHLRPASAARSATRRPSPRPTIRFSRKRFATRRSVRTAISCSTTWDRPPTTSGTEWRPASRSRRIRSRDFAGGR